MKKVKAEKKVNPVGRPPKYREKSTTVAFRIPISKKEKFEQVVREILKKWQK